MLKVLLSISQPAVLITVHQDLEVSVISHKHSPVQSCSFSHLSVLWIMPADSYVHRHTGQNFTKRVRYLCPPKNILTVPDKLLI